MNIEDQIPLMAGMSIRTIIRSMRVPFLVLTPVCVLLGASTVIVSQTRVDWPLFFLALLGAVLAHISVNTLNEYYDFKSGLDLKTIKTRFSGGSGALPRNPEMASAVLIVGLLSLVVTVLIGVFLIWQSGWGIIPVGAAGLLLIVTYTGWVNRHPFLCLVAPGLGFGILMVVGTQYVLQETHAMLPWIVAAVPFFLINNLLLLNQYPDIQADADAGRNHFPIAYGTRFSNIVYAVFILATIVVIVTCILADILPVLTAIALLPMPLAFFSLRGALKHGEAIGKFPQYLGTNVAAAILTPLLLAIALIFG